MLYRSSNREEDMRMNKDCIKEFNDRANKQNPLSIQEGGDHYKNMKIQPIEFIHANNIPFIEGAAIKYLCRHKNKNGIEDLKKASHLIGILIQLEYMK